MESLEPCKDVKLLLFVLSGLNLELLELLELLEFLKSEPKLETRFSSKNALLAATSTNKFYSLLYSFFSLFISFNIKNNSEKLLDRAIVKWRKIICLL